MRCTDYSCEQTKTKRYETKGENTFCAHDCGVYRQTCEHGYHRVLYIQLQLFAFSSRRFDFVPLLWTSAFKVYKVVTPNKTFAHECLLYLCVVRIVKYVVDRVLNAEGTDDE